VLRIVFAGNPVIALPSLQALLGYDCQIVGVLTNPDAASGRSKQLIPSEVKSFAMDTSLPVYSPVRLDLEFEQQIAALQCDLLVCFAYGKIFKKSFLSLFRLGGVNIHPSLLPKYRGPTPIQAALLAGDTISGITLQRLAMRMDAGDILGVREFSLTEFCSASEVEQYVASAAPELLLSVLPKLEQGSLEGLQQDESLASYCHFMTPTVGKIDFSQEGARAIFHKIRAYSDEPRAFCFWQEKKLFFYLASWQAERHGEQVGKVLALDKNKGLQIATCEGVLWVKEVQLQGKKRMDAVSFSHGYQAIVGTVLT
jgi:methionyl-tRNA formyltransferase